MAIRTATDDDIEAIRRVAKQSWERDYPDILTRETIAAGVDDWYAPDQLAAELIPARTLLLVAEYDDNIVGFAHATWSNDENAGYILRLYVDPNNRRQGVGHDLLEQTCHQLSEQGVDRINAMVLAENTPGNTFYEDAGFELTDDSETFIGGEAYRENRYVLEAVSDLASVEH